MRIYYQFYLFYFKLVISDRNYNLPLQEELDRFQGNPNGTSKTILYLYISLASSGSISHESAIIVLWDPLDFENSR